MLAASAGAAAGPSMPQSQTQDIYLSFSYNGLVNNIVTSLYHQDSVYLPVVALFKQLKIDVKPEIETGKISGFFINPDDRYEVDFRTGIAKISNRNIRFDTAKVISGGLDFYVLPSVLSKVFDLHFSVDFNSLTLVLVTSLKLPIVADYERAVKRNFLVVSPQAGLIQAPLAYPMKRSLLTGGILDYSLSAFHGPGQSIYDYGFTGGAQVLGGDAEGSILGAAAGGQSHITSSTLSWRYVFDSTSYISSAGLGNLYSDGLTQYGFRGAQISSEPVTLRTLFSRYPVEANTKPGWDVELYLNGSLVGYAKADKNGIAQFVIPLVYGTSFIQLKCYGPNGEFEETDRRIQVPFTFNPAGQVNYTVSAGKINNTNYNFLSANVVAGLTDWMTDKVGMDYIDNPLFSKPLFYNSLSLRFGPEYMLSLDAAPSAFYRSTLTALYASQAAFDLTYVKYEDNLLYNPSDKVQEADADFYIPFNVSSMGLNLHGAGNVQQYAGGLKTYSYSAFVATNVAQFNASLGYLGSTTDYANRVPAVSTYAVTGSLLYSLFFGKGGFSFLNGSLVGVNARYGVLRNSLDDINFQFSKNVLDYLRIGLTAERDFVNKLTILALQLNADLPFTRSTTSAQSQNGAGWYSENVSGSVGFDDNYGKFLFSDIPWVGHSAVSMRMFVDTVGSGKYVKGEEVIKDGQATLRQAVSSMTSPDGIIRDWNLLPYTQYSVDVDPYSIHNPLWIAKQSSFSFITDPESYKEIDIPFYVGGVINGTVLRKVGTVETAISGLELEISSLSSDFRKSVSVFNDGSFYYLGLPPGEYEAYVDSSQLDILGLYSDPPVLKFKVKTTRQGDYLDGLKIILKDKKATKPEQVGEQMPSEAQPSMPPPPAISKAPDRYVVQLGAFRDRARAKRLAEKATRKSAMRFRSSFNDQSELYVVRSDTIKGGQSAVDALSRFSGVYGFSDSFIIPLIDTPSHYLFWIELASFKSISAASRFSERLRKTKHLASVVFYSRTTRHFAVALGPYRNRDKPASALVALQEDKRYANAFIRVYGQCDTPSVFVVLLATFLDHRTASVFAERFRAQTGNVPFLDFDSATGLFRVLSRAYRNEEEAYGVLNKILSGGQYSSAKVISLQ